MKKVFIAMLYIVLVTFLLISCKNQENQQNPSQSQKEEIESLPTDLSNMSFELYGSTGNYMLTRYTGNLSSVRIPSEYKAKKVVGIGAEAFLACNELEEIVFPKTLLYISDTAFKGIPNLSTISLPSEYLFSFTSFQESPFADLSIALKLTGNEKEIPKDFFKESKITQIILENSNIESIGDFAFYRCESLGIANFPDSLKTIGISAFSGCNITKLEFPDKLETIAGGAFSQCDFLQSVKLPEGITEIPDFAFAECGLLGSINIPNCVSSIGAHAFDGCASLFAGMYSPSIELPENLRSIGAYAFSRCTWQNITIPGKVETIGEGAFSQNPLFKVVFSPGETPIVISNGVFAYCPYLSDIVLRESTIAIDSYAFYGATSLRSIAIPSSCGLIAQFAFDGCSSLTDINYNGTKDGISVCPANFENAPFSRRFDTGGFNYVTLHCSDKEIKILFFGYSPNFNPLNSKSE